MKHIKSFRDRNISNHIIIVFSIAFFLVISLPSFSQQTNQKTEDFVGPRTNIPKGTPTAQGFWSFAIPVPGVLSRSGQPLLSEFRWLKANKWKSVINLRVDGERDEIADDSEIEGFKDIGLIYLHLPIVDGSAPTDEQAKIFLDFILNPANQPAHVHCRGGIGRTGTMIALYRYSIQGWQMDEAVEESRLFKGGVSDSQKRWLYKWAENHKPGNYLKERKI